MILGAIAGATLTRDRTARVEAQAAEVEAAAESTNAEHAGESPNLVALEEKLRNAEHEREVAQHERDQVRERLAASAAMLRTQEQAQAKLRSRDESSQKQALEEARRADEQAQLMELRAYDAELARVRDSWQHRPGAAAALLQDPHRCPPKLRDFTWGYFYSRAKSDRATFAGTSPMNAVAWSPDGKLLASAGRDGTITLRDAVTGKETASLSAHAGGVIALSFSQRSDLLASGGADGTVKLWQVTSQSLLATSSGIWEPSKA